jgi:uncharacterized protein YebE (UPF0316 family)
VFRDAPPPVRAAFWSLAIVVLIGVANLLFTVVAGGTPGFGMVFFALTIFAALGVRHVAEGRSSGRVLVTVLGILLVLYRLAFVALLLAPASVGLPGWVIGVTVAQLLVETALIVAALVLLYRPEVSAHLRGTGMEERPSG